MNVCNVFLLPFQLYCGNYLLETVNIVFITQALKISFFDVCCRQEQKHNISF